jgi:hypothetical protein
VKYAPGVLAAGVVVFVVMNMMIGAVLLLLGGVVFVVEKVKDSE